MPLAVPSIIHEPAVVADYTKRLGLDHFPGRPVSCPLPCELIGESLQKINLTEADPNEEVEALQRKLATLNKSELCTGT